MAGNSSRFTNAGYKEPKFFLPLDGKPLFDWSVLSFKSYFESEEFLFIARDSEQTKEFLINRISILGIKRFQLIYLKEPTRGQAETVYLGVKKYLASNTLNKSQKEQALIIFNIDTIRPHIEFPCTWKTHGWIEVFKAPGDNWSFVLPQVQNPKWVARCAEKVRISDLCCTGLYGFSSVEQYFSAYENELQNPSSFELFVAPLYNHLIAKGVSISWYAINSSDVFLSGVPVEYEHLKTKNLQIFFR